MVSRARENARKVNATNVEFRLGEIAHLPVADASIDVILAGVPALPGSLNNLGTMLFYMGQPEAALEVLREAEQLLSKDRLTGSAG